MAEFCIGVRVGHRPLHRQVAGFAHRIGIAALERLVQEAIARFMPDRAAESAVNAADIEDAVTRGAPLRISDQRCRP